MKFFHRDVPVYYWHAEAIVTKRHKNFIDTRAVYFEASTKESAAAGLRAIIVRESYHPKFFKAISEQRAFIRIPVWSRAFWSETHRQRYMKRRGFYQAIG